MNLKDVGIIKLAATYKSLVWLRANGLPVFFK